MAKLNQFAKNAGYNAGDNYAVKLVRVEDIKIDPELERMFKIQDKIRDDIAEKMKKIGFDKSQPLPVQKGTNILLDGHTRLAAAKKAGLDEASLQFESARVKSTKTYILWRAVVANAVSWLYGCYQYRDVNDGTHR